jgi:hypothetical protein
VSHNPLRTPPELALQIRKVIEDAGFAFDGIQDSLDKRFPEAIYQAPYVLGIFSMPFNPQKFDAEKFSRSIRAEVEDRQQEKKMAKDTTAPAQIQKKLTLLEKLHKVYEAIEYIDKTGKNSAQNYDYLKAAEVTRAIRKAFIDLRIYAEINYDFVGAPYTIARAKDKDAPFSAVNVKCSSVFHDLDSDAKITASGLGTGADTGDKAGYKAMTGALKYCLKNAFLVPDEADPEGDPSTDENNNRAPARQISDEPTLPEASHAAPKATSNRKPTPQPSETTPPEKSALAASQRPTQAAQTESSTEAAPSTSATTVAVSETPKVAVPAAGSEPEHGDAYEGPDDDGNRPPTEDELKNYRKKFTDLGDELAANGKLKASAKLPINRKLLCFLLSITNAPQADKILKSQWDAFFARVNTGKNNPAVGLIGITKLVNKANGIADKEK